VELVERGEVADDVALQVAEALCTEVTRPASTAAAHEPLEDFLAAGQMDADL
jgi:hypothetical protein